MSVKRLVQQFFLRPRTAPPTSSSAIFSAIHLAVDDDCGATSPIDQKRRFQSFSARKSSSSSNSCRNNNSNPLPHDPTGGGRVELLQGLDVHTVFAEDDGHPLAVYTIKNYDDDDDDDCERTPVLLLHGRTWSSLPVYHLVGNTTTTTAAAAVATTTTNANETSEGVDEAAAERGDEANEEADAAVEENRSLLQALYNTKHIQPYAMDFRGFGGTPKSKFVVLEPLRCVSDAVSVLNWIMRERRQKHNSSDKREGTRPALLGWSHGALIAQMTAQRHPEILSKLIL